MVNLLVSLIVTVFHLALVGLDVIAFFAIVRILCVRWPVSPVQALDCVGAAIMDPLGEAVARAIPMLRAFGSPTHDGLRAVVVLLVVAFCRLGLETLLR